MSPRPEPTPGRIPWWAVGTCVGAFLLLAGSFAGRLFGAPPAKADIPPLEPSFYSTDTVRKVRKDMTWDGAPCSSCHDGSEPMQGDPKEKGVFHDKIELKHGRNQHCFNCHNRKQPADFADFDGAPIKLADVQLLCAKCHGTTFRDWNDGSHGRRSGSWDKAKGGPKQTVCIACHEPHWPHFKAMKSAPAPRVNPRDPGGGEH